MLTFWGRVFSEAFRATFADMGQTAGKLSFAAMSLAIAWTIVWIRKGPDALKMDVRTFVVGLEAVVLAWLFSFTGYFVQMPYVFHQQDEAEQQRLQGDVSKLTGALNERIAASDAIRLVSLRLRQGNALKLECISVSANPSLRSKVDRWFADTWADLQAIDLSYAARFEDPSGQWMPIYAGGQRVPSGNESAWNSVNRRTETLVRFLEIMPRPR